MNKRLILIIFSTFLIISCGFKPIYKLENTDFSINEIIILSGNRDLNNNIKNNLLKYKNNNKNKIVNLLIESDYNKNSLVKDSSGKTTEYEISANVIFTVKIDKIEKKIIFQENTKIKRFDNSLDEKNYERNIINNLSTSFVEKLIIELINAN